MAMTICLVLLGAVYSASAGGPTSCAARDHRVRCHDRAVVVHVMAPPARRGAATGASGSGPDHQLLAITAYSATATIWMPEVVSGNEAQFGFFGIALLW